MTPAAGPASATSSERRHGPSTMPSDAAGWWETERARFVRGRLLALSRPGAVIVDVGCGRADMLDDERLADRIRVNVDSFAWSEWRGRSGMHFVVAAADALPFRSGAADLVGSFDVLEHLADDVAALAEQRRIAGADAVVAAAVPADPRLWSAHDEAVGHHRRYTLGSFESLAAAADLAVTRRSYFFSFLWLPAWVARRSSVRTSEPGRSTGPFGRLVSFAVGALAAGERVIMRRRRLPFGTSAWFEMRSARDVVSTRTIDSR